MTNEQTRQKMHPYHQVLQWASEGKDIEVFTGAQWITAVTCGILNAANHFGNTEYYQPQDFRLKPERHIHQDLIDAFKSGTKIQWWSNLQKEWFDQSAPVFYPDNKYRIKPEPKPDVTEYIRCTLTWGWTCGIKAPCEEGIKVTRCGETNKIKSIELLEPQK